MKGRKTILFISEVAIFTAFALVLDFISGMYLNFGWLQGGSISLAMVPIFIMCFRWGPKGGFLVAVLTGVLQIFWGYIYHPIQVILDYPLAYGVCGIASLFYKQVKSSKGFKQGLFIAAGTTLAVIFRMIPAVISGCVYFSTPLWSSIVYNGTYLVPSLFICMFVTILLMRAMKDYIYSY